MTTQAFFLHDVTKMTESILIHDRYQLRDPIGKGSFGEVFSGIDLATGMEVAIKLEPYTKHHSQLAFENKLYHALMHVSCVPRTHYFGRVGEYNALVMDQLGSSIDVFFNDHGGNLSVNIVCAIAVNALKALHEIHSQGFVHRDVKPQNMCVGLKAYKDKIFFIDFGLAKKYKDKYGKHIPYRTDKSLTGTPRFTSIGCHKGYEMSRRDDIEGLMYVLIWLAKGRLPWQGQVASTKKKKHKKIMTIKENTDVKKLCNGLPSVFPNVLLHVKSLSFEERPSYEIYIKWFEDALLKT